MLDSRRGLKMGPLTAVVIHSCIRYTALLHPTDIASGVLAFEV